MPALGFYTCSFCSDQLKPDYPRWFQYPLLLVLVRPYYCPHCGDGCFRPITSLAKLLGRPRRKTNDGSTHWTGASTTSNQLPSPSGGKRRSKSQRSTTEPAAQVDTTVGESPGHERSAIRDEERPREERRSHRSSRRRRTSSRSSSSRDSEGSRNSREGNSADPYGSVREQSRQIASISGSDTPDSYERQGIVGRIYRRLRRRIRKLFGLSRSSSRKRSGSRSRSGSSRRRSSGSRSRRSRGERSKSSDQSDA